MNYRIKKITTKNDKAWYMPQYQKKILFLRFWKNLDDNVPYYDLGYRTKEEAQDCMNIKIITDELNRKNEESKTPIRFEYEYFNINKNQLVKNAFQTIFNNIKSKQK